MADKRKALGRGLRALIPEPVAPLRREPAQEVDLDLLRPNREQPRGIIEDGRLDELAASIRSHGIIQPLVVTRQEDGKFEIVAGERRWRAAQRAGLLRVPVVERTVANSKRLELALIENIQREDLNAIETAAAYARLADEFGFTQEEIARSVGRDRATVANYQRLLRLPAEVRAEVASGALSMGHARALAGLADEQAQLEIAREVLARDLSVRETEALVKGARSRRARRRSRRRPTCTPARPRIASRWRSVPGSASSAAASAAGSRSRSSPRTSSSGSTSSSPTAPDAHRGFGRHRDRHDVSESAWRVATNRSASERAADPPSPTPSGPG